MPEEGPLECPDVGAQRYRGEVVRYDHPLRVAPAFEPKLKADYGPFRYRIL